MITIKILKFKSKFKPYKYQILLTAKITLNKI